MERKGSSYVTRRMYKSGVDAVGVRERRLIKMGRQSVGILNRLEG